LATVALLVAVAKSVSLDNGVDQSQSKMLLQLMKRDTETCQGLGDECKAPEGFTCEAEDEACKQRLNCCEGLACKSKDGKTAVCEKDYLDYDNRCTTFGGDCVKRGEPVCRAYWPACGNFCCKALACSSSNVCVLNE